MAVTSSYYTRTIDSIKNQLDVRGIRDPKEQLKFRKFAEKRFGKKLVDMTEPDLRKVNQLLPNLCAEFLEGKKRKWEADPEDRVEWNPVSEAADDAADD